MIRSVVQQSDFDELIVRPTVELRVGLIDQIKRPAHPVGHLSVRCDGFMVTCP